MTFSVVELIRTKRDGDELTPDEIAWIIDQYTTDVMPDYQMSALLMAIVFTGMTGSELAAWTEAMLHSGDVLDLSDVHKPKVDKHSTGGVGDKISIPLAPVVAACGVAVPMMSGRGLGHTGGTLDKLETIPGFSVNITPDAFVEQLNDVGMVMVGQSETLVPADRRIYALRDATGTVPSVPLISSSIMSKKLAEDLDGLLLDVKVGTGAFMKTIEDARTLANTMVSLGRGNDTPVTAMLTNMDQPLGVAVGNANEVRESIAILQGEGPPDVRDLTLAFATEMLVLAGVAEQANARELAKEAISSGRALETFAKATELQGGDPTTIFDPSLLQIASNEHVIEADRDGWVTTCDAYSIGTAAVRLGAGRSTKEDTIDPGVGFSIHAKIGDIVTKGQPLATVAYRDTNTLDSALVAVRDAWLISDEKPDSAALIFETIR